MTNFRITEPSKSRSTPLSTTTGNFARISSNTPQLTFYYKVIARQWDVWLVVEPFFTICQHERIIPQWWCTCQVPIINWEKVKLPVVSAHEVNQAISRSIIYSVFHILIETEFTLLFHVFDNCQIPLGSRMHPLVHWTRRVISVACQFFFFEHKVS